MFDEKGLFNRKKKTCPSNEWKIKKASEAPDEILRRVHSGEISVRIAVDLATDRYLCHRIEERYPLETIPNDILRHAINAEKWLIEQEDNEEEPIDMW